MQELNEQELEQVVGGSAYGSTSGSAYGSAASYGPGHSFASQNSYSTIQPHLIESGASNESHAHGWSSSAYGNASSYSSGSVN